MAVRNWNRAELLAAFNLYCRTPFGRLHSRNPDIIDLAARIGRTPNALAMKLVNFANLDPVQKARGVKGLSNVANADRDLLKEFAITPEKIAVESEEAFESFGIGLTETTSPEIIESEIPLVFPQGETEVARIVRVRRVQGFFRRVVLSSYNQQCAVCKMDFAELLIASHIIPWSQDIARRADPHNGLALCALHDRAFDQGLIAFDESLVLILSSRVKSSKKNPVSQVALLDLAGTKLSTPWRFSPDLQALSYHRERIFQE